MSIHVGIIGGGFSAQTFHAPFVTTNAAFKLCAFLRTAPTPVKGFEGTPVLTNITQFLSSDELDLHLVIITLPSGMHFEYAQLALNAGKHVVVEKPFTVTSKEADELVALAKEKNLVLTVYHNRRWDSDFLTLKSILSKGTLGKIVSFESHYDRFRPHPKPEKVWREQPLPGSGILYDLGSHLIDQALALFGNPDSVTAHILHERNLPTDDAFIITLRYTSKDLTVLLRSTSLAVQPGPRYTVNGTSSTFIKHGLDPQEGQLKSGMRPGHPAFGVETEDMHGSLWTADSEGAVTCQTVLSERGSYETFFQELVSAITSKDPSAMSVRPEQASSVIRLMELALVSSHKGTTVPF